MSDYYSAFTRRISVRQGKIGRGVYADKDFEEGELVDICPVVTFTEKESEDLNKTPFGDYWYGWKDEEPNLDPAEYGALAGGFGLFYNHSSNNNALHIKNFEQKTIEIRAKRPIKKDEEIRIKYNLVWFPEDKE
jgi:hypothetical protein